MSRYGELPVPDGKKLDADKEYLRLLRGGMKAVVETGTASRAFQKHRDRCRIYGKTGTANVSFLRRIDAPEGLPEKSYSAWFIGWRVPEKNNGRKLAFACMVSHAYGKGKNSGGRVCAPIIASILKQIANDD